MSDRTASMTTVPTTASLSTKIIEGDLNVTGDYYQNGVPFGGGSGVTFSNQETVTFSGTSATLAQTPDGKFFILCQNGLILAPGGADYTLSGAGLTLTDSPEAGDTFFAWYTY